MTSKKLSRAVCGLAITGMLVVPSISAARANAQAVPEHENTFHSQSAVAPSSQQKPAEKKGKQAENKRHSHDDDRYEHENGKHDDKWENSNNPHKDDDWYEHERGDDDDHQEQEDDGE